MTYEVRFARSAERDLRDIYEYVSYELGKPHTAERLVNRFREASDGLALLPNRNRLVDEEPWRSRNTRFTVVGRYLMFYTVDGQAGIVNVIRLVYGGRDVRSQLDRLLGETGRP